MNGPAWHAVGVRGAGVKIGIIDAGFLGYLGLLGSELPGTVTVRNFVDGETDAQVDGTSDHGTNVAELVHDVAPDAQLYFAKIANNFDFEEAADWLTDTIQVDVINTSVGFFNAGPGDGTGPLQAKVEGARSKGILWSTSAGNQRKRHWGDLWSDPNSNNFLNFNGAQEVNFYGPGDGTGFPINPGFNLTGFLRWRDWSGNPTEDYDLHFLRWNGSAWVITASSSNPQTGLPGQRPLEQVTGTTTGSATFYGFAFERVSSNQSVNFNLHVTGGNIDQFRPPRSLIDLADAPSAITVAAVDTATLAQEPFSSEGPTNGPGGTQATGIDKPQLSGFSPVSTATGGTNGFNGTSSAAPHVAGAAGLLRGFYPNLMADELEQVLAARAQDLGTAGFDFQTGDGQVHVGSTPSDADGDGVIDDGDTSAVSGDAACTNGNTTGCDDNCVLISNSNQATFDNDGLGDACDNCIQLANGPLVPDAGSNVQLDTDADGFGNMCDCDFDNDGFCNIGDFNLFLPDFQSGQDSGIGTDMDGDGSVSIGDFNLFLPGFTVGSPGPSAFAP